MKRVLFSLVTVLVGIAVAWGIAEVAVRGYTPQLTGKVVYGYHEELGAIPLPHQRGRKTPPEGPSYEFSHNSYGFRGGKEYRDPKAAPRVLFLGDSFTYGVGVNDEQAFPQQVEAILNAKGYAIEAINAGNPGKGTNYELKLLQTLGPELKPDLVVVCFFWNDFYDNVEGEYLRLGEHGELIPQKPQSLTAKKARIENLPVIRWLLSWSHAANFVKVSIIDLLKRPSKAPTQVQSQPEPPKPAKAPMQVNYQPEPPKPYVNMTQILISRLIKTAKAQGSDILFFHLPDEQQVVQYRDSGQISAYEQDFISIVKAQKEEPYSLTAALTAVPGRIALQYWGHWSPAAHLTAAKYMSGPIEAWLLKKSDQSRQ